MFEKCSRATKRVQMLTQSLTSRLSDWSSEPSVEENESSSIAAIDNGHMSGYGIGLLYRRIRGRLSCQSAYRAPLINPRKRGLLILSHVTRCVRQSAFACVDSTFVLSFFSSLSLFIIYSLFSLFCLVLLLSFFFFFYTTRELEIFNADACSIDRTLPDCFRHWLHVPSHAICSNQKLSISVAPIQRRTPVKLLLITLSILWENYSYLIRWDNLFIVNQLI